MAIVLKTCVQRGNLLIEFFEVGRRVKVGSICRGQDLKNTFPGCCLSMSIGRCYLGAGLERCFAFSL